MVLRIEAGSRAVEAVKFLEEMLDVVVVRNGMLDADAVHIEGDVTGTWPKQAAAPDPDPYADWSELLDRVEDLDDEVGSLRREIERAKEGRA
jgi:hypothetical protein